MFGSDDQNRKEALALRQQLPEHTPYQYSIFTGGHTWAPAEAMSEAIVWHERQLSASPYLKKDATMCALLFRRLAARADKMTVDLERYEQLRAVVDLAKKYRLDQVATLKDEVKKSVGQLSELSKNPEMRQEIQAREGYELTAKKEAEERARFKPSRTQEHRSEDGFAPETYH